MPYAFIFGFYCALCLLFAAIMSGDSSVREQRMIQGDSGRFGPIHIYKKNTIKDIKFYKQVTLGRWTSIEVDVLDEKGMHLFSFSDELWHESGYDSDGHWQEAKQDFTIPITFKMPGKYYLDINASTNETRDLAIYVSEATQRGSTIPFILLAILSLVAAVICYYLYQHSTKPANKGNFCVVSAVLVVLLFIAFFYSLRGHGYTGYNGYHHGPSFFYWGGPKTYHERSHRYGSLGGINHRGGGFSGGK
ncbi:MAG: hypothetical protein OXE99_10925 [Cellvibrionales bacterium]|nr:hypothetical protein [Cellvibrionales bacterium]